MKEAELENKFAFPSHFRFNLLVQSQHTYQSAIGWFELGNYVEAFTELENLPPKDRASIEVMELRCRIHRKLEKWRELECLPKAARFLPNTTPASSLIVRGR